MDRSGDILRRIDELCDQFESQWLEGSQPDLRTFLERVPVSARGDAFRELLGIEIDYRREKGEIFERQTYLDRFPEFAEIVSQEFSSADDVAIAERPRSRYESTAEVRQTRSRASLPEIPGLRFVRELGRGAMGIVYLADQRELHRLVAVKMLRNGPAADFEERARFYAEAEAAAALHHPNIVKIFHVGQMADQPYCVMEYISGGSLRDLIEKGPLAPRIAAEITASLANALGHAHQCGIIHRDLKPANILLEQMDASSKRFHIDGTESGTGKTDHLRRNREQQEHEVSSEVPWSPKVTDFGLARQLQAAVSMHTMSGAILGTPHYLSPEQARGRSHEVDARSDIYTLGVILYELLTCRVPFEGDVPSVLQSVVAEEPTSVRKLRPSIPTQLETICSKAMAKEAQRRYQTAAELEYDLRAFLEFRPIRAKKVSPLLRLTLWARRKPALSGTIAIATTTTLLIAILSYLNILSERDRYRIERDRAEANLYRSLISDATSQLRARATGWYWNALDNLAEASKLNVPNREVAPLRELALECMGNPYPALRLVQEWPAHSGPILCTAIEANQWVATGGSEGEIQIWFGENGKKLASLVGHGQAVHDLKICKDSGCLISASTDGSVGIWPIRDWQVPSKSASPELVQPLGLIPLEHGPLRELAISSDGSRVAVACDDGAICLLDVKEMLTCIAQGTPPSIQVLEGHTRSALTVSFSREGNYVASGGDDQTIRIWSAATGDVLQVWPIPHPPTAVRFASVDAIYYSDAPSFGFSQRLLDAETATGKNQLHSGSIHELLLDPDDMVFSISGDGTVRIWRANDFTELAIGDANLPAAISASLHGNRLAVGYRDGRVRLWEIHRPPLLPIYSDGVAFLGDSHRIHNGKHQWEADDEHWRQSLEAVQPPSIHAVTYIRPGVMAIGDSSGVIRVVVEATGEVLKKWPAHTGRVASLAPAASAGQLFSAGSDGRIKKWDTETLEQLTESNPGLGQLFRVAIRPDGDEFAVVGESGVAVMRSNGAWERICSRPNSGTVLAWSRTILATCGPGVIELRDPDSAELRLELTTDAAPVTALEISPDGHRLASMSRDGTLRLWDLNNGSLLWSNQQIQAAFGELDFDGTGTHIMSTGDEQGQHSLIWNASDGEPIAYFQKFTSTAIAAADADGFITSTVGGGLAPLRLSTIHELRAKMGNALRGIVLAQLDSPIVVSTGEQNWGVTASTDGNLVAVAPHSGVIKIWDVGSRQLLRVLEGHDNVAWCVAFDRQAKLLASGSASAEADAGQVMIWDVATGDRKHLLVGHRSLVRSVAFHPNGRWLATSSTDGSVLLWDVSNGQQLGLLHQFDRMVAKLSFRPDGQFLAAACADNHVAIWDFAQIEAECLGGSIRGRIPDRLLGENKNSVWSLAWSADGSVLASGAERGMVVLWDGESFAYLTSLKAGSGQLRDLTFSRDARYLAGAAFQAPTVLWDLDGIRRTLDQMDLDW